MSLKVRDLPRDQQPRYRAISNGVAALSTAELLELVTKTGDLGINYELLTKAGSLTALKKMSLEEMSEVAGIGESSYAAIQAAIELGHRCAIESTLRDEPIRGPSDVVHYLSERFADEEQEHFVAVLLDTRNRVLDTIVVYKGTVNACHVRPAELFRDAVRRNAVAVIFAHNHPSGDPSPSPEDLAVTRKLVEAGNLLGIEVLDSLVIAKNRFVSMRERGFVNFSDND